MSRPLNPCEQCQQTLKQQAKQPPTPMHHLPQIQSLFAMEVRIQKSLFMSESSEIQFLFAVFQCF